MPNIAQRNAFAVQTGAALNHEWATHEASLVCGWWLTMGMEHRVPCLALRAPWSIKRRRQRHGVSADTGSAPGACASCCCEVTRPSSTQVTPQAWKAHVVAYAKIVVQEALLPRQERSLPCVDDVSSRASGGTRLVFIAGDTQV